MVQAIDAYINRSFCHAEKTELVDDGRRKKLRDQNENNKICRAETRNTVLKNREAIRRLFGNQLGLDPGNFKMRSSLYASIIILGLVAAANSEPSGVTKITLTWTESMDRIEPLPDRNILLHRNATLVMSNDKTINQRTQTSYERGIRWDNTFQGGLGKEWRVVGPNVLRRTDKFPNNVQIQQITVNGNSCTLTITHTLANGAPYYVFPMVSQPGKAGHYSRFETSNPVCKIE